MSRLIILSVTCYRALLIVYPAAHRREYGLLMADAFDDLCQAVTARYGIAGLITLWLETLFDLATTALEEHVEGGIGMNRSRFTRLSSAAAMLGGGLWMIFIAALTTRREAMLADPFNGTGPLTPLYYLSTGLILLGLFGLDMQIAGTHLLRKDAQRTAGFGRPGIKLFLIGGAFAAMTFFIGALVPGPVTRRILLTLTPSSWFLTVTIGTMVCSLYAWRAGCLPRWSAGLLLLSTLILALFHVGNARIWLALPFGLAWIAAGWLLWARSEESPVRLPAAG